MNATDPSLMNRVVIVTGGSRGLGRQMVLALVEAGHRVVITGSRPSAALTATLDEATVIGGAGCCIGVTGDVGRHEDCTAIVARTLEAYGTVDVLVNNAGLGMRLISETFTTVPVKFWEIEPTAWQQIMQTNVNGMFHMAKAVAPILVAKGWGRIINISTSDQTMVRRGYSPYGPSKAAMEAASRVWAQDLADTGVTVNALLPGGAANTDLLPGGPNRRGGDGLLLDPAIMRAPVVWLASDASNGHTGERYIARLWDTALPPDQAAASARSAPIDKPAIM